MHNKYILVGNGVRFTPERCYEAEGCYMLHDAPS